MSTNDNKNNKSSLSPERILAKFSFPLNTFYGNRSVKPANIFDVTRSSIPPETSKISVPSNLEFSKTRRSTFTSQITTEQSTSRPVDETFLKKFEMLSRNRRSAESKRSLLSLPSVTTKRSATTTTTTTRNRSNRSDSPDWALSKFSLPIKKQEDKENSKKENRPRSISPNWLTSRFSLPVQPLPSSTKKSSPLAVNGNRFPKKKKSPDRSTSPNWKTTKFALPETTGLGVVSSHNSLKSKKKKNVSASRRISAPLAHKFKSKNTRNTFYRISQNTLDQLLPKPEIHLYDVVKYGPTVQHKDDFLFGLHLMRSEILNKINMLHYKKKLRNTGVNFIRSLQENGNSKSKTKPANNETRGAEDTGDKSTSLDKLDEYIINIENKDECEDVADDKNVVSIAVNGPDIINELDEVIAEDATLVEAVENNDVESLDEIILIDDVKDEDLLMTEAIKDFGGQFGSTTLDETTEETNVVDTNIKSLCKNVGNNIDGVNEETVKISHTNTYYHSLLKKLNSRNSLDSKLELSSNKPVTKRNSLPNVKVLKKNGVPKKKATKKKTLIKIKWPIARKSLLDLRKK